MQSRHAKLLIAGLIGGALVTAATAGVALSAAPAPKAPAPKAATPTTINTGMPKGYLDKADYPDGITILGPPPAPDSPQGVADRAFYDQSRSLEGSPRWRQAAVDADLSPAVASKRFTCKAGLTVSLKGTPHLAALLQRTGMDVGAVVDVPKVRFQRDRPLIGNDKALCVPRADWMKTNGSYPSGHSMLGWTWSMILAELVPDKSTAIMTRGREFGDSRAICGVHFVSDVEAGRTLGAALVSRLHADPAFEADMAGARKEVAAFRKSGAAADCDGV